MSKARAPYTPRDGQKKPKLSCRFDPRLLDWCKRQPEGTRQYLEKLVKEDIVAKEDEKFLKKLLATS